jgi:hypothetical protein
MRGYVNSTNAAILFRTVSARWLVLSVVAILSIKIRNLKLKNTF